MAIAVGLALPLLAARALAQTTDRSANDAPAPAAIRALVDRTIANQHRDDAALEQYERLERRQVRKAAGDAVPAEDKTFRVIPAGTGIARLQVEERKRAVDAELYRKQLRDLEQALAAALDPNDSGQKQRVEKKAKRTRERAEMVDAVRDAFLLSWLGRESRNGRSLVKLQLDPNPAFRPASRNTSMFTAIRAIIWMDESAAQLARVEAELIRDISFGGGLLGKIYRGSRVVIEQEEIAPGVWLPTRYDYNFTGRKFLFGVELHELTEVSRYRHIGSPQEVLLALRRELGSTPTSPFSP